MSKYFIYTLSEPKKNRIYYVGCTKNLEKRLHQHKYSRPHKTTQRLFELKINPVIECLDECETKSEANQLEKYWIHQLFAWGFNLENLSHNEAWYKKHKKTTYLIRLYRLRKNQMMGSKQNIAA